MARLYKKTRRLLMSLCVISCVMVKIIISFTDDGQNNSETDYANRFKSLFYLDKNNTAAVHRFELPSEGYKLAKRMRQQCLAIDNTTYSLNYIRLNMMYQSTSGDVQLCPIWKAGSTFLKRLFLMDNNRKDYSNVSTPFDISFLTRYDPVNSFMSNLPSTTRFIFIRDPYKRLLSSYIDKLFAPNPVYWRLIGTRAIRLIRPSPEVQSLKCGHDLTFAEYVKYVIIALTPGNTFKATPDIHFQQVTKLCKPCYAKYDFIGKMETFRPDSYELMDQLNMSETKEHLKDTMDELTADDAIRDTLSQPFDEVFREGFRGCISFTEALKRAWMKLQMRGLIGKQSLELSDELTVNITKDQLIELAREARQESTASERRNLKREYLSRFFSSISLADLEKIRFIYSDDFKLFEYNDTPGYIYSARIHQSP